MSFWEEILNVVFPEHCVNCEKTGSAICAICERLITTKPQALSGTTAALFDYRNPLVKKAIWALKYHHKKSLGAYFGNALYREFFMQLVRSNRNNIQEEIILVPVPASKKSLDVRGYNHAAAIAEAVRVAAKRDGLILHLRANLLYKKRETPQQATTRGRAKRKENVEAMFGVQNPSAVFGRTVILIDDVITTGATMNEARRAIKMHNPKRILALAVAH